MAKGLKVGERVTVRKTFRFKRNSETYQQGLKSVKAGQVGEVVGSAEGRSTIVDFEGKRAVISTQRLERVQQKSESEVSSRKRPTPTPFVQRRPRVPAKTVTTEQANPQFITYIANRLIRADQTNPDGNTIVEIRLSDLPEPIQKQIQTLVKAKLDLEPENSSSRRVSRGRR